MSTAAPDDGVLYEEQVEPEYGILGMTLRELLIVALWVVGFVVSFFPLGGHGASSLWQSGLHWILPVAVPTVAVFLIVLRRFSPEGIRRVGSLGVDQFASVAFSVSALLWVQLIWDLATASVSDGAFLVGWSPIVETVVALGLVVLTVLAPLIPGLKDDFHGRLETLAHRNANPARPVIARPRPEREMLAIEAPVDRTEDTEAAEDTEADLLFATGTDAVAEVLPVAHHDVDDRADEVTAVEEIADVADDVTADDVTAADVTAVEEIADDIADEETHPAGEPRTKEAAQPFWILSPDARDVLDEHGRTLFSVGPHAWALVIEDRGGAYVVRHDDGRIGYLHDITNITKG
ncbi:hypothetical protein L2X99_03700 [Microbacterium sp. KUDC0406]|uniref:hypothetical protein n=1 Tax=Microbacterium sp. KUDC0406 TaxID=2909588 RepID=UPI001F31844E|nr:hypothetical protein [Microbacterium sp. KUDC0406]UJP10764.1 hypothetical protein L2X99_03700 [Microbacterium sp. KUDC0406]